MSKQKGADAFLAMDTEDDSIEQVELKDHAYDKKVTQIAAMGMGSEFHNTGDVEKFKEWLRGFPDGTICYAHNLGYDLGNLFRNELDSLDVRMVGSRIIRARWENIIFMDSMNIWPMGAKRLGEAFGLKKLVMDVHSRDYVMRDVEIVHKAMTFARQMAMDAGIEGGFPATLGTLCVKIWSAMGGTTWPCGRAEARESLYGGRVELFSKGGEGRIAYVDVNSLYPSVMRLPFPTEFRKLRNLDGYGIATVDIIVPEMAVAPLPVRDEDGRILYPCGKLRGTWTLHEIRNAIDVGCKVVKATDITGSKEGYPYYKQFVNYFYDKRKSANDSAQKLMYKLLMNNRYGQLCMKGSVTNTVNLKDSDFNKDGYFCGDGVPFGSKKLADVEMPLPDHVNYLHGAYVTSYGRLVLQKYLRMIPSEDLIYCDTDSIIFFNKDDKYPFPISNEMGEMKLEGIANRCYTVAPKMYLFGHHLKVKGVPKRRVKVDGKMRIPAVDMFRDGEAEYHQPYRFREAVNFYDIQKNSKGEVVNEKNSRPLSVWRRVKKKHKTDYDKKTVKNGVYFPKKIEMF